MDRIFTGYFAKTKQYQEAGLTTIAISAKVPDFYEGLHIKALAPTWDIFSKWKSGEINDFEYTERFIKEVLEKLDKKYFINNFKGFEKPVILLCYEAPGKFCHRHLVADWLESGGLRVEEFELC